MQRLSGLDASFLYFETRSQLLHVCGLIILDVSEMKGGYSFGALRAELDRRVSGMPAFRRKLHDSVLNVDHPVWIEAEDFDIDHHLHRVGIPAPGGDRELAELCGHLAGQPIDRSMPLWQMYVLEELPGGRIAVFVKMHHSTVDGVTGANMLSQLCTLTPEDPELDSDLVRETAGGSGALELAVGGALSRLATPWRLASLLPGTLGVLPSWVARARKGLAMPAPFTAPRTPFNSTISGHRSLSFASVDLDQIKRVKNAFGTTVNDVVLAVCSTALRTYLDGLDALPSKPLIAMVPMSVHSAESRPGTNRVSGMFMSLSTDLDDPVERLEAIRDANTVAKDHTEALDANLLTDWAQFAAPSVFGSAVRMYSRLRLSDRHPVVHNLVVSNVPGPNLPLYFLGARIEKMMPLGPVFHGAGLNCTVMSFDGRLHFGFIACKDLVSDPWPLADAVGVAMEEFVAAAAAREASGEPAAERKSPEEVGEERRAQKKASAEESAAKETAAKVATAKETAARKSSAREATAKEATARKSSATEASASTTTAKKSAAPTSTAEKTAAKKTTASKTAAPRKTAAKKTAAKKTAPKKSTASKGAASDNSAKKSTSSKSAAKKTAAKKTTAKKTTASKTTASKTTASKTTGSASTAKKAPARKSPAKKASSKPTGSKPVPVRESDAEPAGARDQAGVADTADAAVQTSGAPAATTPGSSSEAASGTVGTVPTAENAPAADSTAASHDTPDSDTSTAVNSAAHAEPVTASVGSGTPGGETGTDASGRA